MAQRNVAISQSLSEVPFMSIDKRLIAPLHIGDEPCSPHRCRRLGLVTNSFVWAAQRIWPVTGRPMVGGVATLSASAAHAEVCDKVRPAWDPSYGKVGLLGEFYLWLFTPVGFGLVVLVFLAVWMKRSWLSFICATLLGLVAVVLVADWVWLSDEIGKLATQEGCRSSPYLTVGVLIFVAVVLLARRSRRLSSP